MYNFSKKRSGGQAVVFYLLHIIVVVLIAGLCGFIFGLYVATTVTDEAHAVELLNKYSGIVGILVATIYTFVCSMFVTKTEDTGVRVFVTLVSTLFCVFFGIFGGFILPAIFTTRVKIPTDEPELMLEY